ncbi:MAG: hypothetical protein WD424_11095 [Paenibacillaceae bacterium]
MTRLRKTIMGYDTKQVNRHLRSFKFLSELEISELELLVMKARTELAQLSHESIPPENIELTSIIETSVGLVEEIEIAEEDELTEIPDPYEEIVLLEEVPAQLQRESNRMGRLLMFQRKIDAPIDQDEPQTTSDQLDSFGYWDSIEQYLVTPVISEVLLNTQAVLSNALLQPQDVVSNSAVGLPRYFDYNLPEAQTQLNIDSSQPIERRIRSNTQAATSITSKKSRDNTNLETNKLAEKIVVTSIQSQSSKEITREVRQLRYKYIVGKWAGEDLVNNQGKLIVGKNNPITEEIVDIADREGKLALLIIGMIIPGIGEDI